MEVSHVPRPRLLGIRTWAWCQGGARVGGLVLGLGTCAQLRPDGSSVVETADTVPCFGTRRSQTGALTLAG